MRKTSFQYEEKCRMIPSFVIVGPQKTGTTALMNFLSAHPDIEKSEQSGRLSTDYFRQLNLEHDIVNHQKRRISKSCNFSVMTKNISRVSIIISIIFQIRQRRNSKNPQRISLT